MSDSIIIDAIINKRGKIFKMSYEFNADEIFEMAVQMEINGAAFYSKAAEGTTDEACKKLLTNLALMEKAHEKTFAELRNELTQKEKQATVFDPEGESELYLKALVDTRVFFDKEMDPSSLESILKEAITAEKDSIVFYLGMKDIVAGDQGKKRIDGIIKEEMGHIKILSKELMKSRK